MLVCLANCQFYMRLYFMFEIFWTIILFQTSLLCPSSYIYIYMYKRYALDLSEHIASDHYVCLASCSICCLPLGFFIFMLQRWMWIRLQSLWQISTNDLRWQHFAQGMINHWCHKHLHSSCRRTRPWTMTQQLMIACMRCHWTILVSGDSCTHLILSCIFTEYSESM